MEVEVEEVEEEAEVCGAVEEAALALARRLEARRAGRLGALAAEGGPLPRRAAARQRVEDARHIDVLQRRAWRRRRAVRGGGGGGGGGAAAAVVAVVEVAGGDSQPRAGSRLEGDVRAAVPSARIRRRRAASRRAPGDAKIVALDEVPDPLAEPFFSASA